MLKCPECDVELEEIEVVDTHLDRCPKCKGFWVEYGELQLVKRGDTDHLDKIVQEVEGDLGENVHQPGKRGEKLICPKCKIEMDNYEYSQPSGIWIDRCHKCKGTWLEEGELSRIDNFLDELDQWDDEVNRLLPLLSKTEFEVNSRFKNIEKEKDSIYKSKNLFNTESQEDDKKIQDIEKLALIEEVLGNKKRKKKRPR